MNFLISQKNIIKTIYKKTFKLIVLVLCILLLAIYSISFVSANTTGINPQIPYSGSIIKNDGTVLDSATGSGYRAKFIIYNVPSGGTAIYEEIRDGITTYDGTGTSPSLSVNDGKFEILLGSQNTTNFTSILNDDTLYLELQLDMDSNGSYEEVFSPRRRLGSAVSAINSLRLVAANGGTSTNTLSLDPTGNLIFTGDSTTERMRISGAGTITASALGGPASTTTDTTTFNRVILANSSGQFSQIALSSISGGSGWALTGNNTTDAWNGSSGTRLGTTSAQPLIIATTNATAQDIRFFTGANGANERMRILGSGNIGIGTTSPQARLDVNGGIRVGDDTSTCSSSNVGTLRYNNGGLQVCNASGWSYITCPTGYIKVPGNSLYLTNDFCVMKYEAKAVSTSSPTIGLTTPNTGYNTIANSTTATTSANGRAVASVASGYPIANINQTTAASYCSNAGASLITNAEWMTIARNIEAQLSNWTTGTAASTAIGTGGLYRGHSDTFPTTALEAGADTNGYIGTGQSGFSVERRTHTLSNGETIWDISGNVWELVSDTILGKDQPTGSTPGFNWRDFTALTSYGTLSYNLTRPSNTSWNSTQNMGKIFSDGTSTNTTIFAFLRGGALSGSSDSGVFALNLFNTPSNTEANLVGFRCVIR